MPDDAGPSPDTPGLLQPGEEDILIPLIPENLWLGLVRASYVTGEQHMLAQLSWGADVEDGDPVIDGQVWFTLDQMDYLTRTYLQFRSQYVDDD